MSREEIERLRRLQKMQRTIFSAIIILGVFLAGIAVGKKIERRQAANAAAIEQGTEEASVEEVPATEAATEEAATEETATEPTVSENSSVSINEAVEKPVWNEAYVDTSEKMPLKDREAIRSSYEETTALNAADKEIIHNSTLDFSNMKIACLGDSITEGANGATPYPTFLKDILGAEEVLNLGIGGSTICSDHDDGVAAMSDRMDEIPEDTDLVIVIGGTNDNFYQASWQFGFMDWETKGDGTFCGDLQLLMRRFKWLFPDTKVIFFTPPSNTKIDELRAADPNLLDQAKYAEATVYIGAEEGMPVVDLYNQNFLNAHDTTVATQLLGDKVHPNTAGNQILAERIASEIIKRYE